MGWSKIAHLTDEKNEVHDSNLLRPLMWAEVLKI